jgi:TonB family protein
MIGGTYFDGQVARPQPVTAEFGADNTLRISGDSLQRSLPLDAVRVSDRLGDVPRFIYLPDGAVIETADNSAIDDALAQRRRARRAHTIHFLETHRTFAAVACVAMLLLIVCGLYFGPPALSRLVAHRIPREFDARFGQAALATIAPYFSRSTLTPAERDRVRAQLERLLPDVPPADRPRIEFRAMNGGLPNAFALPGNIIVVTDELLRLPAHDDELAAVLAHEIAHLENRHGLQGMLRGSMALLIVSGVTGDFSTLTSFAAAIPISILTKGYSRDMEREADRAALALLRARGIETRHFSTILVKLDATRAALARGSTYLSTHPSNEERITLFGALSPEAQQAARAEGTTLPIAVYQPAPQYPAILRLMKIEGEVVLEFTVDFEGNVRDVTVVRSTRRELEPQALAEVQRWKYRAGRENFQPVAQRIQVPIRYNLTSDSPAAPSP